MMKVKPAKLLVAIVLLFFLVVIGYGVTKANVRPGPRQLEQMERDKILGDPEVKVILAWEKRTGELQEQIKLKNTTLSLWIRPIVKARMKGKG